MKHSVPLALRTVAGYHVPFHRTCAVSPGEQAARAMADVEQTMSATPARSAVLAMIFISPPELGLLFKDEGDAAFDAILGDAPAVDLSGLTDDLHAGDAPECLRSSGHGLACGIFPSLFRRRDDFGHSCDGHVNLPVC